MYKRQKIKYENRFLTRNSINQKKSGENSLKYF